MTPARISSVTASPVPASERTTCAVPSVGWPANGISNVGVKMRTRAVATVDGSTNVVSERLNCSASACIVASSSPRRVLEHAQRVAGEHGFGEHVDEAIVERGHGRSFRSGSAGRRRRGRARTDASSDRASARKASSSSGGRRDDERIAKRGKLRSIARAYVGIVVPCEELADERIPVAGGGRRIPALDRLASMQRNEMGEARGKRCRVGEVVRVLVLQERDAKRRRRVDANALARCASPRATRRGPERCRSSCSPIRRRQDAADRSARAPLRARCRTSFAWVAPRRASRPAAIRDASQAFRGRAPAHPSAASASRNRLFPDPVRPQITTKRNRDGRVSSCAITCRRHAR